MYPIMLIFLTVLYVTFIKHEKSTHTYITNVHRKMNVIKNDYDIKCPFFFILHVLKVQ